MYTKELTKSQGKIDKSGSGGEPQGGVGEFALRECQYIAQKSRE